MRTPMFHLPTKRQYATSLLTFAIVTAGALCAGCGGGGGGGGTSGQPSVTISPAAINMLSNGQQAFTTTVTGLASGNVSYSIQEGLAGGSISQTGNYIAPGAPGTYHVVATSIADLTKTSTATITVSALTNNSASGIYITDDFNNRVVRVNDMSGGGWSAFAGFAAPGSFRFTQIQRIAVAGDGRIYVTDAGSHRITRMDDITGKNLVTFGSPGSGVGQFNEPLAIAIGPGGKIFIADYKNHRIVRIDDMTGAGWTTLGVQGNGIGQFNFPQGVFPTADGKIYIADTFNNRIVRVDDMSGAGWTSGNLTFAPTSISVAPDQHIYLSDYFNNRIARVDAISGTGLVFLGSTTAGSGVGQFNTPSPIFAASDGRIYVADTTNDRLVRMNDISGAGWTTLGSHGSGVGQFEGPLGVFVVP